MYLPNRPLVEVFQSKKDLDQRITTSILEICFILFGLGLIFLLSRNFQLAYPKHSLIVCLITAIVVTCYIYVELSYLHKLKIKNIKDLHNLFEVRNAISYLFNSPIYKVLYLESKTESAEIISRLDYMFIKEISTYRMIVNRWGKTVNLYEIAQEIITDGTVLDDIQLEYFRRVSEDMQSNNIINLQDIIDYQHKYISKTKQILEWVMRNWTNEPNFEKALEVFTIKVFGQDKEISKVLVGSRL